MNLKKKAFIFIFLFTGVIFLVVGALAHKEFKLIRDTIIEEKSQTIIDSEFINVEWMLLITTFILFLVLSLFIYYFLKSNIFNPLNDLSERISSFEDFSEKWKSSKTAFEKISIVFDSMENHIGNLKKELEDKKTTIDKLNETIEERQRESEHLHRLASVGTIASGITHEIGNPLGAISAYTNSLSEPSTSHEDITNYCRDIQGEIKRIEGIIKKVSSFAKCKEESEEIIDLHDLIDEAIELCSYHKNFRKIEIVKELGKEPIFIEVRKNRLLQVFINLFINSLDSMQRGGELCITSSRQKGIPHQLSHLISEPSDEEFEKYDMIDIMIKDSGKGIEEGDFAKVFSPFFTKGKSEKGTGLGLHISYQIIRSLGGAIYAEKGENSIGTIIHVQIPHKDKEFQEN